MCHAGATTLWMELKITLSTKGIPPHRAPQKGIPPHRAPQKGNPPPHRAPQKGIPPHRAPQKGIPPHRAPQKGNPDDGVINYTPTETRVQATSFAQQPMDMDSII